MTAPEPEPDLDENEDHQINLMFAALVLVVVGLGLAIALSADPSDGDNDAWRELGGALVAGGVLAGLVVWYEGKREGRIIARENAREDRLVAREEQRSADLFKAAWQRDVFLQLFALQPELEATRRKWRKGHEWRREQMRKHAGWKGAPEPLSNERTLGQVQADNDILIAFLRDPALTEGWDNWLHPRTDLDDHHPDEADEYWALLSAEYDAWGGWIAAVKSHLAANYER